MQYETTTIECGGIPYTEYRYEPEIQEDEPIELPLLCSQCDHYRVSNRCVLTGAARRSTSLACPEIKVTCPF